MKSFLDLSLLSNRKEPKETKIEHQQRVVIFKDVNDTLFLGDAAKGAGREDGLQKLLAEEEQYAAVWDASKTDLAMTFRQFVDKFLCPLDPNEKDKAKKDLVKKNRETNYYNFISFLEQTKHPLFETMHAKFEMINQSFGEGNILPSFFEEVRYLEESGIPYTMIFRTFGKDMAKVEEQLAKKTELKINYKAAFTGGCVELPNKTLLSTPKEMLDYIKPSEHAAWLDNFKEWKPDTYEGAKPFPIDFTDPNVVYMFFDDNVKKKIVCVKPTTTDERDQDTLQADLIKNGNLVSVDTYEALINKDYFVEKIKYALQKARENNMAQSPVVAKPAALQPTDKTHGFDSVPSPVRMHGIFNYSVANPTADSADSTANATLT